ncbi:hypothetical protein Ddc_19604 [Ditylenchus destructor]|nr:hypothetical protein Ddc_19604 [Ditylenchus destructor]
MLKSARPAQKQAKPDNEAQMKSNAMQSRSGNRISMIAAMDNGTMVEAFKYLSYCQLATNSLVSKRFRNLIRTHRHNFALLYVDQITMKRFINVPTYIRMFGKGISPNAYNEWVIRNQYSKKIPLESQIAGKQSTQHEREVYKKRAERKVYELSANAVYTDSTHSNDTKSVFSASVELNHESWPLFQHFGRLLSDPFIYIRSLESISQIEDLYLTVGANNSDHDRLQCEELVVDLRDDMRKSITWIKDHARCDKFRILGPNGSDYDEEFLDFFMTGANCTAEIEIQKKVLPAAQSWHLERNSHLYECAYDVGVGQIGRPHMSRRYTCKVSRPYECEYAFSKCRLWC